MLNQCRESGRTASRAGCPGQPGTVTAPGRLAGLLLLLAPMHVAGLELAEPEIYEVENTWSAASLGVPRSPGAMLFSIGGDILYVVGAAESARSALYAVPVARDPATKEIVGLGPAGAVERVFEGGLDGLDAGLELGPGATFFYTYFNRGENLAANRIAQRHDLATGPERVFSMLGVGVPQSVSGLTFSPHMRDPRTGFGQLQVSAWGDPPDDAVKKIYNVPLTPDGGGFFEPRQVEVFVTLPDVRLGTGAIQYVPSGSDEGNLMHVNWESGTISVLSIDRATGFPIDDGTGLAAPGTDNPRQQLFARDLGQGPWGLEFDPVTNDLFVSTWRGAPADSIIQISGFPRPPPVEFVRGDSNGDGAVDVSDPVRILIWLFSQGAAPGCVAATNANGDEASDIADATYLLEDLFVGGAAPLAPFPDCGTSELEVDARLGCVVGCQ